MLTVTIAVMVLIIAMIFLRIKRVFKWLWTGIKPGREEVGPTLIDICRLREIDKV